MPAEPVSPGAEAADHVYRVAADPDLVRLEGLHCVKHALRFGADVPLLVTADRAAALELASVLAPDLLARLTCALVTVPPETLAGVGAGRFDVVGFARRSGPRDPPTPGPAVLLEDPRNLGNLGAVVRVAAGFGARAVRTTGTVDPWHPTVIRAAAGLHFAVSVERVAADGDGVTGDGPVFAFDPSGEDVRGVHITDDAVLAFGSERHGLSAAVRRRADRLVAIPMRERVSSYNLATSVAVALYQWSVGAAGAAGAAGVAGPRTDDR